jgi:phosphatidylglycerol:prolipoprotein diacylglycerol transferase
VIDYPSIDPVALSLGPIKIHWYGLTYLGGLAFAWWLARQRASQPYSPVKKEQIDDLIFYAAVGIVLGGRAGYALFYGLNRLLEDPLWLFRIWEGGMAFHGGFLGVLLAMALFSRQRGISWGRIMDFVAPLTPIGLGLGRLGNFIGQELWGRPAEVAWAMVFPKDPLALARHPSQLYQFALEGCLLFLVLLWFSRRPRPEWAVSGVFLLGYGALRFIAEFFREPDAHIGFDALGWMTRGQILCLPMLLAGAWLLYRAYHVASSSDRRSKL